MLYKAPVLCGSTAGINPLQGGYRARGIFRSTKDAETCVDSQQSTVRCTIFDPSLVLPALGLLFGGLFGLWLLMNINNQKNRNKAKTGILLLTPHQLCVKKSFSPYVMNRERHHTDERDECLSQYPGMEEYLFLSNWHGCLKEIMVHLPFFHPTSTIVGMMVVAVGMAFHESLLSH